MMSFQIRRKKYGDCSRVLSTFRNSKTSPLTIEGSLAAVAARAFIIVNFPLIIIFFEGVQSIIFADRVLVIVCIQCLLRVSMKLCGISPKYFI